MPSPTTHAQASAGRAPLLLPHQDPFNEEFGFKIKHIDVISNVHSPGLSFTSGRWKPPTRTTEVRLVENVRYNSASQDTMFLWRPIPTQAVSKIPRNEEQFYHPYKASSLFWATDSGTFMHVPFDCTVQNVEDPTQDDSEHEDEHRNEDDNAGMEGQGHPLDQHPNQSQRIPQTWRRPRFYLVHPSNPQPTITRVGYEGGHFLGGNMPSRWRSTLIPSVHTPEINHSADCQLAGDLPTILGLVAFCHADNNRAIGAVATWFPPSRRTTHWGGAMSAHPNHPMQTCDQRSRRGMVIETFYDSRRPDTRNILEAWEKGENGPIIT